MKKFKMLTEAYDDTKKAEYNLYLYGLLSPEDQKRYTIIPDLEGPIKLRSGKIVYYDAKEGQYYDRDSDMYIDADEIQIHSENVMEEVYGKELINLVNIIKEEELYQAVHTLGEFGAKMKERGYENAKNDFGV